MIQNKKILLTGGAGFMGTHLAQRLSTTNDVTLFDFNIHQNSANLASLHTNPRVQFINGNVCDAAAVNKAVGEVQIVVHLASLLGVQHVVDNALATIDTVLVGTRNVLNAAAVNKNLERIVNVSTSEIFGDAMSSHEGMPAAIGTRNDPRLSYASAKLMGEHLLWAFRRDFDLPAVNIRPFNTYGPLRKTHNAVGVFAVRALHDADIFVHGDGSQIRSWCYVDDFCRGLIACLDRPEAIGEDFNIGNPSATLTIYELASRIIELTGSKSRIVSVQHPYSDVNMRSPHCDKAKRLLGFQAKICLSEGLKPTIAWYREHLSEFKHWL